MLRVSIERSGWRGISLIVITYVLFLIFAQFAFLHRLAELGIAGEHLKAVLTAMAAGGILLSLLSRKAMFGAPARLRLQVALAVCAGAALSTLFSLTFSESIAISFLIGAGLGLLTVTLVSNLNLWMGTGDLVLKVGLGTGTGYFICNLPPLFTASPKAQAVTAAILCFLGIFVARHQAASITSEASLAPPVPISFRYVLVAFTALIWLDSAAFFIIQNTPVLQTGTWRGTAHRWIIAVLHLFAAIVSARLLLKRGISFVLGLGVCALAFACLLLLDPGHALLASFFYPIGVSLYSVALVAYPSFLSSDTSPEQRSRRSGLIYAFAGWGGSALGIGMGQHLGRIPVAFILPASILVLTPPLIQLLRQRGREIALTGAILLVALFIYGAGAIDRSRSSALSQVERGRQVYISEGCIHCHSQYVRPNTSDELMWGPVQTMDALRREHPPLIGNRRQGPDLSQVGNRRSPLWLKIHLYDPRELNPKSFMPSYAYLFDSPEHRGDDIVAYLSTLKSADSEQHLKAEREWTPSAVSITRAKAADGKFLYRAYCTTCHDIYGQTYRRWRTSFKHLPLNLATGPWRYLHASDTPEERWIQLAQIVKFGIPGTDMPGHEYFSDSDVSSLANWTMQSLHSKNTQPLQEKIDEALCRRTRCSPTAVLRIHCLCSAKDLYSQSGGQPDSLRSGSDGTSRAGNLPCSERLNSLRF